MVLNKIDETRSAGVLVKVGRWMPKPSVNEWFVFVFAFSILFLEATLFSTLLFTHTYLVAMQAIAFALLGTGLGSIAGYVFSQKEESRLVSFAFLGSLLSLLAVFLNIIWWPESVTYSPLMVLPFFFGSAVISETISRGNAAKVYFYDLLGASSGIIAFVVLLPILGEEGNFIFLGLVLATIGRIWLNSKRVQQILTLAQFILAALFVLQMLTGVVNFATLTRCYSDSSPTKVFCKLDNNPVHNRIVASRSDLAARIDIAALYSTARKRVRLWVHYNGMTADKISSSKASSYVNDRRVPHKLAEQPDVLIIGTAGDGIIKPAHLLAGEKGRLDGVEINTALVSLMRNHFYEISGKAYRYLDNVIVSDARTYLNTSDQQYGVITLLNTYTGRLEDSVGAPEYLHTVEAMESYLDHLTPDGFIIFEVRDVNELAHVAGLRILNALMTVQAARGDSDLRDNFFIYEYYPRRQRLRRSNNYTMMIFKKTSWQRAELDYMNGWVDEHNKKSEEIRTGILMTPDTPLNNDYSRFVRADDAGRSHFFADKEINRVSTFATSSAQEDNNSAKFIPVNKSTGIDLSAEGKWLTTPTTDDQPFLADANPAFAEVSAVVKNTTIAILGLAFLLVLVMWRGKSANRSLVPFLIYFACAGAGYLLIEVALIQWLQIFTGLPAYTFVFVLGTLLLFSGVGSYISQSLSTKKLVGLLGLLVLVTFGSVNLLQPLMLALQTPSLALNSLMVAALLTPLAFLMGIPLPFGLRLLKARFSHKEAALSFGINSLFATLGSNLSILVALYAGFDAVFRLGVIAYVAMLMALVFILLSERFVHKSFSLS